MIITPDNTNNNNDNNPFRTPDDRLRLVEADALGALAGHDIAGSC